MVSCRAWTPVTDIRCHRGKLFCYSTLPPLLALILKEMLQLFIYLIWYLITAVSTMANIENKTSRNKKDNLKSDFVRGCYKCNITH